MTCALEFRDQKRKLELRKPCASTLIGCGVLLALSGGFPNGDLFALICDSLTSVVSATLNLLLAFSELLSRVGLYPDALRPFASATPYPGLLYGSSGIASGAEPAFLWRGTLALAAWALSATLCTKLSFRRPPPSLD